MFRKVFLEKCCFLEIYGNITDMHNEKKRGILCNLCNDFGILGNEIKQHPLWFFMFSLICVIVAYKSISEAALFVAASVAGFFAYQRAKAVEQGMKNASESRDDERFSRSCAMLGANKGEAVQIGGLISLDHLAKQKSGEYKQKAFNIACAFIRTSDTDKKKSFQEAINIFLKRGKGEYFYTGLKAALSGAQLSSMDLKDVCLSGSDLTGANLTEAIFSENSDFSNSNMTGVKMVSNTKMNGNFSDCDFARADLMGGKFEKESILDGTDFSKASIYVEIIQNVKSKKGVITPFSIQDGLKDKHNLKKGETQ